jgi:hypothetical protein
MRGGGVRVSGARRRSEGSGASRAREGLLPEVEDDPGEWVPPVGVRRRG